MELKLTAAERAALTPQEQELVVLQENWPDLTDPAWVSHRRVGYGPFMQRMNRIFQLLGLVQAENPDSPVIRAIVQRAKDRQARKQEAEQRGE